MEEQIIEIAHRVKTLREILGITAQQAAENCGLSINDYQQLELGLTDISVGTLHTLAKSFGVEVSTFLSGEEPRMRLYTLTRKGQGVVMKRRKAYSYKALAANFINRKADPFLVKVEPKPDNLPVDFNNHPGQEFNLILKGSMKFFINDKEMILNEGDSIYFDSGSPHGMRAADNASCEFLAIIF
ncbi:MAG TPA: cupin domain-containing protein [Marinilabiliaceae bacterium]|nr:cupin domain-containing protein [Marinilabiliaceae bacterium]